MKGLLRLFAVATLSLYLTSLIFAGISVSGGMGSFLAAGLILTLAYLVLRPILTLVTLPLNIVTFGLFSIVTNMIILYFVDVIFAPLTISSFTVPQFSFLGITVSSFYASTLLSYLLISATIYAIQKAILWLFDEE